MVPWNDGDQMNPSLASFLEQVVFTLDVEASMEYGMTLRTEERIPGGEEAF